MVEVVQHRHDRCGPARGSASRTGRAVRPGGRCRDRWSARRAAPAESAGRAPWRPRPVGADRRTTRRPAAGQLGHPGAAHRLGDGVGVVSGPLAQHLLVREPAPRHQVGDGDALRRDRRLGEQSQPAGHLLGVQAADVAARPESPGPPDGLSSRASPRSSVDLPHALGPTIAVMRPSSTSTDRSAMTARVVVADARGRLGAANRAGRRRGVTFVGQSSLPRLCDEQVDQVRAAERHGDRAHRQLAAARTPAGRSRR